MLIMWLYAAASPNDETASALQSFNKAYAEKTRVLRVRHTQIPLVRK